MTVYQVARSPGFDWTPDAIDTLTRLWNEGRPTAEIGKIIGCGKNAAVGKAARLGLPKRAHAINGQPYNNARRKIRVEIGKHEARVVAAKQQAERTNEDRTEETVVKRPVARTPGFDVNAPRTCQFIEGDPSDAGGGARGGAFAERVAALEAAKCGAASMPGRPYCGEHAKRAYVLPGSAAERAEVRSIERVAGVVTFGTAS